LSTPLPSTTTRGGSKRKAVVDVARLLAATERAAESLQLASPSFPLPEDPEALRVYSIQLNRINAVRDAVIFTTP